MDGNPQEENLGREFSSSLSGCHAPPVVGRDESRRTDLPRGEVNLAGRIYNCNVVGRDESRRTNLSSQCFST